MALHDEEEPARRLFDVVVDDVEAKNFSKREVGANKPNVSLLNTELFFFFFFFFFFFPFFWFLFVTAVFYLVLLLFELLLLFFWLVGWFPPLGFSLSPFFFIFQIQCLAGFIQSALGPSQNGHRNSATSLISLIRPELHRPFSLEISLQWSTSSRNVSQKMRRKQYSRRNSRAKRRLHRPQL